MLKPEISIIVPIYNTSRYLKRCLNSIVSQTFKNFEVICVDDCSTDYHCRKIINQFASNNSSFIKIFKPKNEGPGAARNLGLDKAIGEYVIFIDSDDYVSPKMFEILISEARKTNADVVYAPYWFDRNGKIESDDYSEMHNFRDSISDLNDLDKRPFLSFTHLGVWGKIYKLDLLNGDKPIRFPHLMLAEDSTFTCEVILAAKKFSLIKEKLYYYFAERDDSLRRRRIKQTRSSYDFFLGLKAIEGVLKKYRVFEKYQDRYYYFLQRQLIEIQLPLISDDFAEKFYCKVQDILKNVPTRFLTSKAKSVLNINY